MANRLVQKDVWCFKGWFSSYCCAEHVVSEDSVLANMLVQQVLWRLTGCYRRKFGG